MPTHYAITSGIGCYPPRNDLYGVQIVSAGSIHAGPDDSWRFICRFPDQGAIADFIVRDCGGAPCHQVRKLGTEKLALIESQIEELKISKPALKSPRSG